jgi:hypothetical protein
MDTFLCISAITHVGITHIVVITITWRNTTIHYYTIRKHFHSLADPVDITHEIANFLSDIHHLHIVSGHVSGLLP